jgi:hypothetical protein
MQHVIKKKKKHGWWPKLAIRHGHLGALFALCSLSA